MKSVMASDISADLSMLMDGFSSDTRMIPSSSSMLKKSLLIPAIAVMLSIISSAIVYFTGYKPQMDLQGFISYFMADGWIIVAPTIPIGLLFTLMAYNNVLLYMSVPENVRKKSLVIAHLKKIAKKTVTFFVTLMILATILSGYSNWFAFSISGLLFALLFVVNLLVGVEINRLGAGFAIEKISNFIKKI